MKRTLVGLLCILFLFGCGKESGLEKGLVLRNRLLSGDGCEFRAEITADYGKELYVFSVSCKVDNAGNLTFCVISPESISGISGTISATGGKLTFDDHALAFPVLADGMLSPVSAPWFFITALRSGYLKACEENKDGLHLVINDSYAQDAIQVDVYTDPDMTPVRAELVWQGMRVLTVTVENFNIV